MLDSALLELMLLGTNALVRLWYTWGLFVGLLVALLAVFWVFYNASRQGQDATLWKVLSIVAFILTIPSVIFRLSFGTALRFADLVIPAAYLGLVGAVLALICLILYLAGVGTKRTAVCPQCGQPLDPSWDHCPYCAAQEPAPVTEPAPVGEPLPVQATAPLGPPPEPGLGPEPGPARPANLTEVLKPAPPSLAWLVTTSGPRLGKEFRLGESTTIGRDATQCDVVLEDAAISRQHTKIKLEGKRFIVYDLGSTNHTYVNDKEVYRQALANGDKIRLGATSFTFMLVEEKKEEQAPKKPRRSKSRPKKEQAPPEPSA